MEQKNFHGSHLQQLRENYFVRDTTDIIIEEVVFAEQWVETSDVCSKYL